MAGIGVAVRDFTNNLIVALTLSQKIQVPHSVELARLWPGVVQSLLLIELSLFQVVFEGDSLRVIQAINNRGKISLCLVI